MRDILAFAVFHYPRSPVTLGLLLIAQLVFGVPLWKDAQGGSSFGGLVFAEIILFVVLVLSFSAVYPLIIIASVLSRRNRILFAPHTLTATHDHLADETSLAKAEIQWSAIQRVAVTRKRYFLYLSRDNAIVIPRDSFASPQEEAAFIALCRERSGRAA